MTSVGRHGRGLDAPAAVACRSHQMGNAIITAGLLVPATLRRVESVMWMILHRVPYGLPYHPFYRLVRSCAGLSLLPQPICAPWNAIQLLIDAVKLALQVIHNFQNNILQFDKGFLHLIYRGRICQYPLYRNDQMRQAGRRIERVDPGKKKSHESFVFHDVGGVLIPSVGGVVAFGTASSYLSPEI